MPHGRRDQALRPNGVSPPTTCWKKRERSRPSSIVFVAWRRLVREDAESVSRCKLLECLRPFRIRPRLIQQAGVVNGEEPIEARSACPASGQRQRARGAPGRLAPSPTIRTTASSVIGAPPSSSIECVGGCCEILVRVDERSVEIEDDQADGASRPVVRRGGRVDWSLAHRAPAVVGELQNPWAYPVGRAAAMAPWYKAQR